MTRALVAFVAALSLLGGGVFLARATSHPIAGIGCDPNEGAGYHIHAFLTIADRGRLTHPPAGVGIHYEHLCLYWLHTHDASGVIHVEAPHGMKTTLGQFFAVWGEPLTRHRVAGVAVRPDEHLRVYVDGRLYPRQPATIPLRNHESITLEVGPPFGPPVPGAFKGL